MLDNLRESPKVVSYSISTSNHNVLSTSKSFLSVVSYSISTSNHNLVLIRPQTLLLYLIPFLHQTTTMFCCIYATLCCILFHFYIKPQLYAWIYELRYCCILFHFYIKPQLTIDNSEALKGCILFHFYIKPQLMVLLGTSIISCILFHFYIKPQRRS